ncbi:hypothetical protein ASD88_14240 [Pelomonas sp. Root662]|nr:hypothetical protein ASC81_15715 [Pelomonas sp. Root405]KRA70987.1 hypothetical protein ASD88_14240 [Pelomonas sp. Root662]
MGRLSPEKGPEIFVRAALMLKARMPEAHAVLVGEGPMHGELQSLVHRFGLAGQVHLAGVCHDMPALYGELDVLVCCSHTEAMPLALMEAMACGLPAVATRVGGVPDIVEQGATGWLVAPCDFDAIGYCCARLLADPDLRRSTGARARQRAVQRLGLGASAAGVSALLERLGRPAAPHQLSGADTRSGKAPRPSRTGTS